MGPAGGAGVELQVLGYQFPDAEIGSDRSWDPWDANWLIVKLSATDETGRSWSVTDPALTTWEALRLGYWLRHRAAREKPADGQPRTQGLSFVEPLIEIRHCGRVADAIRLDVVFREEASPPWSADAGIGQRVAVVLRADELRAAVTEWLRQLRDYPIRGPFVYGDFY